MTKQAPTHEALRPLYRIRYMLARPLQVRILPSFFPVLPIPFLKHLPYITLGHTLLILPWIIMLILGVIRTFDDHDLKGTGSIASGAIIAAFLTASKANSILLFFCGLSFERVVPIHNMYACLAVVLSIFHLWVAYKYGEYGSADGGSDDRRLGGRSEYAIYGDDTNLWKFLWDGSTNWTGTVTIICMIVLVGLSFFRIIRKVFFEAWLYTHILCAFGLIIFGFMHSVPILALPLAWWMLDWAMRFGHSLFRFPTKATLTKLSDDLVQIQFPRTFHYEPGHFVQISIQAIDPMQFHPVTISSAPYKDQVTLDIKVGGNWTKALAKLADHNTEVQVLIDGPYGNLAFDFEDDKVYPIILCIAGGIGVTPCQSVASQLLYEADKGSRSLSHLRFVWAIRHTQLLDALPTVVTTYKPKSDLSEEAEAVEEQAKASKFHFQPDIYVTRAAEEDELGSHPNIHTGRPDILRIIEETVTLAKEQCVRRIAVITCGPQEMVNQVKNTCRKMNGVCSGVAIDIHDEIFNF